MHNNSKPKLNQNVREYEFCRVELVPDAGAC